MAVIARLAQAPLHVNYTQSGSTWATPSGDDVPWVAFYSTNGVKLNAGRYRIAQIHGGGSPTIYTSGFVNTQNTRRDVVVESSEVFVYLTDSYAPGEVIIQPI